MSLLRHDVSTSDWVIFAPDRGHRPHELGSPPRIETDASPSSRADCPFCPGNETQTGPELYALRGGTAPDSPGWRVRVVPNKYPALRGDAESRRQDRGDLFHEMEGCGAHEVIIESPEHDAFLGHQPVEQIEFVLRTLQVRFHEHLRDARFQAVIPFKNHGERAGTSLRHPHWQVIAIPVVPRLLRLKHAVATDYFDLTGRCLYCVMLAEELEVEERVVAENEQFAAIAPYASHRPYEVWILPKVHQASFGRADPARFRDLAELLRAVLSRLHAELGNPDFNLTVNSAPRGDEDKAYFLWHIEILPRLARPAGFELGSGMAINTVLPEEAARRLRPRATNLPWETT